MHQIHVLLKSGQILPGFWKIFKGSEGSPWHGIRILMCNTKSMNNLELILLKYKRPMSYFTITLIIVHQPCDRLAVGIQSEIRAIKIGPKMYDSPYNSKALPLIWRVVALSLIVSGFIGDNIFFTFFIKLAKNSSNTKSTPVSVYNENFVEIKSSHNEKLWKLFLECVENFLSLITPCPKNILL